MNEFSLYLLKSAIGLAVLYTFYWGFLRQETFFSLNRFYLLASMLLSFIFPWLNWSFGVEVKGYLTTALLAPLTIAANPPETDHSAFGTVDIVQMMYFAGAGFFLGRFLWQLMRFAIQYFKSPKTLCNGFTVVITKTIKSPASFFGILFLSQEDLKSRHLDTIISHESYHHSQFHSLDIILVELLAVVQWFNPFVWLYKNALQAQHEYAADRNMLRQGEDKLAYQSLLFEKSVGIKVNELMSYFNNSLLKTRMKMMNKQQSELRASLKYLFAVPLFVLLSVGLFPDRPVFAQENTDADHQIDEMPKYPGGDQAMYHFIQRNIKYPKSARLDRAEGKVFVSFLVDKTGKVTNIEAGESNDLQKLLQEIVVVGYLGENATSADNPTGNMEPIITEVKYVISRLAQFTPGKKAGKNVAVRMTIPITFKLDGE